MTKPLDQWRAELRDIDAELIQLIHRRTQLAVELLQALRANDPLGDLDRDADRLRVLMSAEIDNVVSPLDRLAVEKIFRRIINEQRRLARCADDPMLSPD